MISTYAPFALSLSKGKFQVCATGSAKAEIMMTPDLIKRWFDRGVSGGGPLYLVGGTVRDMLLGADPKDIDLVCKDAKVFAEKMAFRKNAALVVMEKKPDEPCYRVVDRAGHDFLDIAEMRGETIQEDLGRRDFTINALAVRLDKDGSPDERFDPFDGASDLEKKIIRMVSEDAFVSDPLRILRAVRFSAALGFQIEEETLRAMTLHAALLNRTSAERITAELSGILRTDTSSSCFRQMDSLGILEVIFPEIVQMKGCEQSGYHHKDVWQHSLLVMERAEHILNDLSGFCETAAQIEALLDAGKAALLKLACLLHDAGKPSTKGFKPENNRITFYGHDKAGAAIVKNIAERMKLSNQAKDFLVRVIDGHLRPLALVSQKATNIARMRWFRKMRDDSVPALILSIADVMSSLGPESDEEYRTNFSRWAAESIRLYFEAARPKMESPLLINGHDLIAMGMQPGIALGNILYRLRFEQDMGRITSREEAIEAALKIIQKQRGDLR